MLGIWQRRAPSQRWRRFKNLEPIRFVWLPAITLVSLPVPGPSRKSSFPWMGRSILNRIGNSTEVFSPSGIRSWISMISSEIGRSTTRICDSRPGPSVPITVRRDWSIRNFVSGMLLGIPTSTISAQPMTKCSTMCGRCVRTWHRSRAWSALPWRLRDTCLSGMAITMSLVLSRWTFRHRPCWRFASQRIPSVRQFPSG